LSRMRASLGVLFAVLAAGLVASCGGGASGGGGPSKLEFAGNADKVCSDVNRRVAELSRVRPRSVPDIRRFIEQLKATVSDGIKRLQALERPKGSAGETARKFTDTVEREYEERVRPALNQLEQAVVKRDKKALKAASKRLKQAQARKRANQLAAQLGANTCASS
jgi:predicted metal-dependent hydrolase